MKKMSLFLQYKLAKWGFESDSVACKNNSKYSLRLIPAPDKFSWSNLCDLGSGNLFTIAKLESNEDERKEVQNSTN